MSTTVLEERFLKYDPQWKTEESAIAAGWSDFSRSSNWRMLSKAGWCIEARRYLRGWALWMVREYSA